MEGQAMGGVVWCNGQAEKIKKVHGKWYQIIFILNGLILKFYICLSIQIRLIS